MENKPPLILLYHKIKELNPKSSLCVTPQNFIGHIKYLLENSFNIISLYDIINKLSFGPKAVVITFDDGYRDNYLNAYPVLSEFKIPASIFIVSSLIGQSSLWDKKNNWPSDELLSWPEVIEMSQNGITIGSHSRNHRYLTKMKWWPDIWQEIKYSKETIEEKINKKVLLFSYPFGHSNFLIRQMVRKAGYRAACGIDLPGQNKPVNLYNLPRLEINTKNSPLDKFSTVIKNIYKL